MSNNIGKMPINPTFNPEGEDIIDRQIWFGNSTNLIQLNNIKYDWAYSLYKQMQEQFWIPQRIDLTQDTNNYNELTVSERKAFDGILSYLTFLDSIQVSNLPNIQIPITAPEIRICLNEQCYFETIHAASYQYIIESVIPDRRELIYDFWRTDKVLSDRCKFIAQYYQKYAKEKNKSSYFISLVANYLLESLYFYNGFQYFYVLASRMLMNGSADIIKLINRDELSHVRIFQKLIPEAMEVFPHSIDQIYEMFATAVDHERRWTNHIIGGDILGITETSTEQYTKYLANIRLKAIGLNPLYEGFTKNPYKHLEKIADTGQDAHTKANFFETTVTSYIMSSGVEGWDEF